MTNIRRQLQFDLKNHNAILLLGPRKTGKSTLLRQQFSDAYWVDLLLTEIRTQFTLHPEMLRQIVEQKKPKKVVIDEIQKVPELLDEVHYCLENTKTTFILCGSSARKLKKVASGVLGGRAARYEFFPLTTKEIPDAQLEQIFNQGLIPQHYLHKKPDRILKSYIIDYLEEEIRQEATVKNLPSFSRFLETAALMNGELLNFKNVSSEAGVSANTVKAYYQILVDTLFGFYLPPWEKSQTRRMILTSKFYLFDCGVVRALKEFQPVLQGTMEAGKIFETFLINEIRAYLSYSAKFHSMFFWRTSTDLEVDLVVGRKPLLAIEFKCSNQVKDRDLKGLRAFLEENPLRHKIVVYCGKEELKTKDGIEILPWKTFCKRLWENEFL